MKFKHIFLILFVLSLINVVTAAPGFPHEFYGNVTYNGAPANNIVVDARIDGVVAASTTASNGYYLLIISNDNNDREGKTINFFVNNIDTGLKYIFGGDDRTTELDLSASGSSSNGGGSQSGGGGSGGSGGGGGGGPPSPPSITTVTPENTEETQETSESKSQAQSQSQEILTEEDNQPNFFQRILNSITGSFTGPRSTATGISIIFLIIIFALFLYFIIAKKIKKDKRKKFE